MREIVLDTETTGLSAHSGDRVVEIGCVEIINRFPTGRTFHCYINPECAMPESAFKVHGLSAEFLAQHPCFHVIADSFLEFICDDPIVAHNADFDVAFLNMELQRINKPVLTGARIVNTLLLARRRHPAGPNRLDDLCQRYKIDNSKRELHGALLDAQLLAEVYAELVGGRQTAMVLNMSGASQLLSGQRGSLRPRPEALTPLIREEEMHQHRQHIEELGKNALWNTYFNS